MKVDDDLLLIKYLYRIESVDRNHNNIQTLSIYKTKHGNWTIRMTIFFICIWAKFSFVWNISALFEYFPNYILMLLAASKFKTSLPLMLKRSSVDQYMSTRTTMMFCSVRRNHNSVLSSLLTYYRVCKRSNRTDATYGAETA